jgi:hypothetical protein
MLIFYPALCMQVSKLSSLEEEEEDEEEEESEALSATGLYALPSIINHACFDNCTRCVGWQQLLSSIGTMAQW